ncbi:MAG TPA: hypothetical protein VN043_15905 [Rhodanobacter sp.]|nr:hypothetical protein [Rhodanobacter sp.]
MAQMINTATNCSPNTHAIRRLKAPARNVMALVTLLFISFAE